MNREFLDLYNRELAVLREQAKEFGEEFPGIAERLGGLVEDRADPMIAGLLEGAAFLAARVQLKIKDEFPEFARNLLEQLVPNYLAPTPSALLARIAAPYGDPALRAGVRIGAGANLDATYLESERQIACRFRLTSPVTLWPLALEEAEYFPQPGPLQALGAAASGEAMAGLRLRLACRTSSDADETPAGEGPDGWLAGLPIDDLPVHLVGPEADAVALYEQLFANVAGVYARYLDAYGDPIVERLDAGVLSPVGFGPNEHLLPKDTRIFDGFDLLREYFLFPRKFLGFRLNGLRPLLSRIKGRSVDVLVAFDEASPRLASAVRPDMFALFAAPAVNLFEMSLDRVPVDRRNHEFHLVPDRSRTLDFEPHRILSVFAHAPGRPEKQAVRPLYSASGEAPGGLAYTVRRRPRLRSSRERASGGVSDYVGTDIFLSLAEQGGIDSESEVAELSVRALCSNRHLPELLPVGAKAVDFRLTDDASLAVTCAVGPTRPREPVLAQIRGRTEAVSTGDVTWRLISLLSLNHLGIVQRGAGARGQSLRETLTLFGDLSDGAVERRIRGVRSVDSRPVTRRLRQRTGTGVARGTEITVVLDEKAFEGSGPFLLGAILDRFFAEYAGLNHFTQTVIRTPERGEIMRGEPRAGTRRLL